METRAVYHTGHIYKIILKTNNSVIAEIPFGEDKDKALETLKALSLIPFKTPEDSIFIVLLERENKNKNKYFNTLLEIS